MHEFMNYQTALLYLDSFIDYEKKTGYIYSSAFNLERVRLLLENLGNPHLKFRSIHIAGTKGKGSVCAMLYAILREAKLSMGLYTSPHLLNFRERIRVSERGTPAQERMISEDEVVKITEKLKGVIDENPAWKELGNPTFFEVYTALAFEFFALQKVDIAVVEVGMGGRLDATNVLKPLLCGITGLSFDHTDKLGSTLASIAAEKSGIIKEGVNVVSARQEEEAAEVLRRVCKERHCKLYEVGRDFIFQLRESNIDGQAFSMKGVNGEYSLRIPLLGGHQIANATMAAGMAELLGNAKIAVFRDEITRGLSRVKWPGRLHIISKNPYLIIDGAQNAASARALAESIKKLFSYEKLFLVLAVSADKDIEGIGRELSPLADEIILTMTKSPRAAEPQDIHKRIGGGSKVTIKPDSSSALSWAKANAKAKDLILITGSLFLAGEILKETGFSEEYGLF